MAPEYEKQGEESFHLGIIPDGSESNRRMISRVTRPDAGLLEGTETGEQLKALKDFYLGNSFWILQFPDCPINSATGIEAIGPFSGKLDKAKEGEQAATPYLVIPRDAPSADKDIIARVLRKLRRLSNVYLSGQMLSEAGIGFSRERFVEEIPADFEDNRISGAFGVFAASQPIGTVSRTGSGGEEFLGEVFRTIWSALPCGGVYLVHWYDEEGDYINAALWILDRETQKAQLAQFGLK